MRKRLRIHGWRLAGLPLLLALAPPGAAREARPAAADHQAAIATLLALPVAVGLVGARDRPVFAWVEVRAGVRNIWLSPGPGQAARRLTRRTDDDGIDIHDLALSDDGGGIAWTLGGDAEFPNQPVPNTGHAALGAKQTVWVGATGGSATAPRMLGEGHSPVFSPDGRRVAFVEGGALFVGAAAGDAGATRVAQLPGSIETLSWSPDGRGLLFASRRGDHGPIMLFDIAAGRLRYLDPDVTQDLSPAFSPDGRRVAFIRAVNPPDGATGIEASYWQVRVVDVASGAAHDAWQAPAGSGGRYYGTRTGNLFWADGDRLLFPSEASGWLHVLSVPVAGGAATDLTPGDAEVENFTVSRDGRTLLFATNLGEPERRHLWQRPVRGGAPATRLTGGAGIESFPTVAGDALAIIASGVRQTPVAAAVAADGRLRPFVPASPTQSATAGFVAPEPVRFRAGDGVEVHATWFRARGEGKGRHPALIFLHGGPRRQMLAGVHPMPYYANAYLMNQHLAADGFDVLAINYRSGTGYGRAFREAADTGARGASEYRDVLAAAHWLQARDDIDPRRIGLWGGSWGGYLTALGLARDSAIFAAGADLHGVHNRLGTPPPTLSPDAQQRWRDTAWASSPFAALDRWCSPVLLVHGDDDRNVPFGQTPELAAALRARGVPYQTLMLPDERHEFFRYASWLSAYGAVDAFLTHYLQGPSAGAQRAGCAGRR